MKSEYATSPTGSQSKRARLSATAAALFCAGTMLASIPALGDTVKVDVGGGKTVDVRTDEPLKIAMFMPALNTSYLQANVQGAKDAAEKVGATLTVFDAKLDPVNQLNQMKNAIQTGQYNAFLIFPLAGPVVCEAATVDAPAAGILVSAYHFSLCDATFKNGDDQAIPGMVQYVGGSSTYAVFEKYLSYIIEKNPGPQKVGIITGLSLADDTLRIQQVVDGLKTTNPDFQVVGIQNTDYTIPDAHSRAQNLLQSHPDLSIIITTYSNITRAAATALEEAGRLGQVKLYDFGGTIWTKSAIEAGHVEATVPFYAYTATAVAVENLALAHQGKPIPRYIENDGGPLDAPTIVDKTNVSEFKPESD